MTLREARCQFTRALASLIIHATAMGYEVALDEVTEHLTRKDPSSDHMPNSLHHVGLAADLNLYKDGVYLDMSADHEPLGLWWEKLGDTLELPLCWGGRFKQADGNHYSFAWLGRK